MGGVGRVKGREGGSSDGSRTIQGFYQQTGRRQMSHVQQTCCSALG